MGPNMRRMNEQEMTGAAPCVFLDRDGTLNEEKGYLYKWEDWEWLPGVVAGLAKLSKSGFRLVVISNQAGMARGYYGPAEWHRLCHHINEDLVASKLKIDGFYYCPHHPDIDGECSCRKPGPGLFFQAAWDLGLDLRASWMIGDKASDVLAGRAAGCHSLLVESGYGKSEKALLPPDIHICANFSEAVGHILNLSAPARMR